MRTTLWTLVLALAATVAHAQTFGVTVRTQSGGLPVSRIRVETGVAVGQVLFTNAYLTIDNQQTLQFREAGGLNYAAIRAPAALAADYTLTLPVDDGAAGQVLSTDGAGGLSWIVGGGGAVASVEGATGVVDLIAAGTAGLSVANSGPSSATITLNDLWVDTTGDTMTGALSITAAGTALSITNDLLVNGNSGLGIAPGTYRAHVRSPSASQALMVSHDVASGSVVLGAGYGTTNKFFVNGVGQIEVAWNHSGGDHIVVRGGLTMRMTNNQWLLGADAQGTAAAPAVSWNADPDTGMFSGAANTIGFSTGGVQRFTVNADGTVTMPSLAAEPVGAGGQVYYNSTTGKLRGFDAGAWGDLIGGAGGGVSSIDYGTGAQVGAVTLPTSGTTNYVQNQTTAAQTGGSWVDTFHRAGTPGAGTTYGQLLNGTLDGVLGENNVAAAGGIVSGGATGTTSLGVTATDANAGVYALALAASGTAVIGTGQGAVDVWDTNGAGGVFTGTSQGLFGFTTNVGTDQYPVVSIYGVGAQFDTFSILGALFGGVSYKVIGGDFVTVATTYPTDQGDRVMYAPESPSPYFFDLGSGKLENGEAFVKLDPLFAQAIFVDETHPLHVTVTPTGGVKGTLEVTKKLDGFEVRDTGGASGATFDWTVTAKWKPYKDVRNPEFKKPWNFVTGKRDAAGNTRVNR